MTRPKVIVTASVFLAMVVAAIAWVGFNQGAGDEADVPAKDPDAQSIENQRRRDHLESLNYLNP